ncbi:hypothetical protein [Acinetobacter sp. YH01006]|uniref:hypothetical protein n=1 Tax=Acinetobacter sp. YH01006 TaxID=2601022 RepID=UPI0015D35EB8|nr:hypothetical protein [Acinetobacter sp. YH01006]
MEAIIKELSPDSVAVVVFFNQTMFGNPHVRESIQQKMSIMSKRIGKTFIALPCGANIQELDDQQLRELGLIRADCGSNQ